MTISEMRNSINGVENVLKACEKAKLSQDKLNAVVTFIDPTEQLNELENYKDGLLYRVPVVLKDNVNTKGIKTTASSKILENYIPVYDATIVEKLKKAGAIIIAKSSLDELAMGGTNLTAATGPVYNPYDLNRISGGSSGGSAALVAAGVVPMAIGSDTGDSIRKPASYCNVVGLKPTYGRISRYGVIPYASSLDHVGVFTQNVEDAAISLEVLAGRDDRDMTSSHKEVPHYAELLNSNMEGKKIVILKNVIDSINEKETIDNFNIVIEGLRNKGAIISEVVLNEQLLRAILPTYYIIANCEATANHSNLDAIRFGRQLEGNSSEEIMTKSRTEGFGFQVRKRFVMGSYGLMVENQDRYFRQAQKVRRLIVNEVKNVLDNADVIIAPASRKGAPLVNEANDDELSNEYLIAENHMILGNFTGYPSCTVPMGFTKGMPVGINCTAKAFDEVTLLNVCLAIEEITKIKNESKEV